MEHMPEHTTTNSKRRGEATRPSMPAIRAQQRRWAEVVRWQEERDQRLREWHEEAERVLDA